MNEKILAINPGSTSTKVALFDGDKQIFKRNISHDVNILRSFPNAVSQLEYRKETILNALAAEGLDISGCAAFSGRGGGLASCPGGVYEINENIIRDASGTKYSDHPASLGNLLAYDFAKTYGGRAFTVNPPSTDEFRPAARITGIRGVMRVCNTHALNQKETAIRVTKEMGLNYKTANVIVAHLGGGVSIGAHEHGLIVESNDIIRGDGPMTPNRAGSLPARDIIDMCFSGTKTREEMMRYLSRSGGFVDHLGTDDMLKVKERIASGDKYAKLVYEAFVYQIAKQIGAMAAVLHGKVDVTILTGGIANDADLVEQLREYISFIAPVVVRAGEFEMEALAAGALRVLRGEEQPLVYTGIPVFTDFDYLKFNEGSQTIERTQGCPGGSRDHGRVARAGVCASRMGDSII